MQPTPNPPIIPYVNIKTPTFGEKVDKTIDKQEKIAPAIHTGLHPNLFTYKKVYHWFDFYIFIQFKNLELVSLDTNCTKTALEL